MNTLNGYAAATRYLEMEESKCFNHPQEDTYRTVMTHFDEDLSSKSTVLAVGGECGERGFAMLNDLDEAPRTTE